MRSLAPPEDRIDYRLCRYGGSRLMFRGPQRPLDGRHVTALGGTATFGRHVARPWPDMAEEALGLDIANLGYPAAGIEMFLSDPALTLAARGGRATVIEALDAACLSNRFYRVHPRRNDRFLGPSDILRRMCPAIDWTEYTFVRHMLQAVGSAHPDAFAILREELRSAWVARMRALVAAVEGPVILLWMGLHDPRDAAACARLEGSPLFVDAAMLSALRGDVEAVLTCIASPDDALGDPGTLPGPRTHVRVAKAVTGTLEAVL
ncbi:MAG: DUF6473 family protein [Hasllibacter sp.]